MPAALFDIFLTSQKMQKNDSGQHFWPNLSWDGGSRAFLFAEACDRIRLLCYLKAVIPPLAGEWWARA
jgi:hypothetical protein